MDWRSKLPTLKTGDLAYWNTAFHGMVPCKVLSVTGPEGTANSNQYLRIRLTATRGALLRGEEHEAWGLNVVPRKAVSFRKYSTIITLYNVIPD